MATAEIDTHAHSDHDHPSYLAHHFDTAEQQYDAGKLGMWLFLITEILFFSGLFCAYAIYRSLRPEVYAFCSQFLNTELGAINTAVLLFSSLTMAWAVRASQLEQHKTTMWMIAITIACAMIFLGVKAVEYSHKWDIGLLPAGFYHYQPDAPHPEGISDWLVKLCIVPGILVVGMVGLLGYSIVAGKSFLTKVSVPLTLAAACYFVGVGLGMFLESGGDHGSDHGTAVAGAHVDDGHDHEHAGDSAHDGAEHSDEHAADVHLAESEISSDAEVAVETLMAENKTNTGVLSKIEAERAQASVAGGTILESPAVEEPYYNEPVRDVNSASLAGVFFSIYYCMTGLHAIHIILGIAVLSWLLVRAARQDFNRQYFGPVDYVGLYWHIVDLIWIYLFPLLYLIG